MACARHEKVLRRRLFVAGAALAGLAMLAVGPSQSSEVLRQTVQEMAGKDGAPMLLIPAGEFMMGSVSAAATFDYWPIEGDEEPVHRVVLDAFYLDKFEVTNRLFQKFVQHTGYQTTAEREGKAMAYVLKNRKWEGVEVSGANWRQPEGAETVFVSGREEHPVVSVSWHDAESYCRHYGKRLPTEAEWEHAARAGTHTEYWWGDGSHDSRLLTNVADRAAKRYFSGWTIITDYDDGYARTAPVGSFQPNSWGLHDMLGNVWEWVVDWYDENYYRNSPSRNPTGPSSGRLKALRGGSWINGLKDARAATRSWSYPDTRGPIAGFRCAQDTAR
jgi:sulfatase modifying factor 1